MTTSFQYPGMPAAALTRIEAQAPAARLDAHEKSRVRASAVAAKRLYPGPVGEMLARELMSWDEFGFRLGGHALIARLVDDLLRPPAAPAAP